MDGLGEIEHSVMWQISARWTPGERYGDRAGVWNPAQDRSCP
jgi:hypothetical protein